MSSQEQEASLLGNPHKLIMLIANPVMLNVLENGGRKIKITEAQEELTNTLLNIV